MKNSGKSYHPYTYLKYIFIYCHIWKNFHHSKMSALRFVLTMAGNWMSMFTSESLKPNLLQEDPYNLREQSRNKYMSHKLRKISQKV
jgi:hypothetical protein